MADQAGIELILSAPDVKPIMDAVIDDWKEINRQEKLATEQLEKYNAEMAKENDRLKEMEANQKKLKDSFKDLEAARKQAGIENEARADRELFAQEHQQKGILNSIKAYFAQKAELKSLGKEIDSVSDQLRKLDLRQQAISLSARRGNTVAIKEYAANEKAIASLNRQLSDLNEKYNVTGAKLELTKSKFAGFSKALAIISTTAKVAAASVALIGVAALAIIVGIGKQNDQVQNQFKKTSDAFKKAREEFSNALAPVAFAFGKIFESMATSFAKFLDENSESIFAWARNLAGIVGGLSQSIPVEVDKIGFVFKKLTADIQFSLAALKVLATGILAPKEVRDEALANYDKAAARVIELGKEIAAQPETTAEAYKRGYDDMVASIDKVNFKQKNLTKEQIEAIKKLQEEYKRLTADINKQIEALDVKEAGPFAGVLLKAQLAAREIEAQGELAVDVARKLGKNQATIRQIQESVARLSQAIRDDAVKFLTDQADEVVGNIQNKLNELAAERAGRSADLQFRGELEAQFKEIQLFQQIQKTLIDDALNRGESAEVISELIRGLERANQLAIDLSNTTALDFAGKKVIEVLERSKAAVEKSITGLQDQNERLRNSLEEIAGDASQVAGDARIGIQAELKINEIDLAVAQEQIRQFEESFEIFKKTGVAGVVETEATIRIRVEQQQGINNIEPGNVPGQGPAKKKGEPITFEEGLEAAVEIHQTAFDAIDDIVLNSIDIQIEAIDRLVQARIDSVDQLQRQVEQEAKFKEAGLANDYDLLKKRLNDEIKLKDDAEKKAIELQAKRAKAQRNIEAAQQVSSLITAVAQIFASYAGIPFGIGQALAIAGVAAMFASFLAAKIQASKITAYKGSRRMGETFGEFAPGEGYDDSPGRDRGLSVVDSRGRLRGFVGGDEYLHKQSVSRKHRKGFDYLNQNESKFKDLNLLAMLKALESGSFNPAFDIPDMSSVQNVNYARIVAKNEKLQSRMIVVNSKSITKEDLKEAVREIMKEHAQTLIDYHESRPDIIPNDWLKDYTQMTSKSSKRFKKA